MSDTHGMHRQLKHLPEADLLIHAGDFSTFGNESEAIDFLEWFVDLPYKHKVFICGNHDIALRDGTVSGLPSVCHYPNYSIVEIEGVKVCGVPFFVERKGYVEGVEQFEAIGASEIDLLVSEILKIKILTENLGHFINIFSIKSISRLSPSMIRNSIYFTVLIHTLLDKCLNRTNVLYSHP